MFRKSWSTPVLVVALVLALVSVGLFMRQEAAASPAAQGPSPIATPIASGYFYSFAAKFVCGVQHLPVTDNVVHPGEPSVKPGNYATEINVHNFNYRNIPIRKKLLVLVENGRPVGREPKQVEPKAFDHILLGPDGATMDDCNRIWQLLYPNTTDPTAVPAFPGPLTIGYMIFLSPVDLDVNVVYTAEVPGFMADAEVIKPIWGAGITMDVETVQGKRVYVPVSAFPTAVPNDAN